MRTFRLALVRALVALLALVSAAAPAAAAVGEGVLASHAGRSAVMAHAEDARRPQCPYVHADDCVLCALLALHALPHVRADRAVANGVRRESVVLGAAARACDRTVAAQRARGPPTG